MSSPCIFCQIVNGKIPAEKIYENNNALAFLDINLFAADTFWLSPKNIMKNILLSSSEKKT